VREYVIIFRELNCCCETTCCVRALERACVSVCVCACVRGLYVCYITRFSGEEKNLLQQNVNYVITQLKNVKLR
jgi:hypothetical protein